jgi:hypothetical protein
LKIKLKDHRSGTIEVIEAESQVMLNTLTEHEFQDSLKKKKRAEALKMVPMHKRGTTSRVMVASKPKVNS